MLFLGEVKYNRTLYIDYFGQKLIGIMIWNIGIQHVKIINNQKPQIDETAKIEKLAKEFLSLEKPTKQLLNELIEKITISENKEINIYFKFNELNEMKEI